MKLRVFAIPAESPEPETDERDSAYQLPYDTHLENADRDTEDAGWGKTEEERHCRRRFDKMIDEMEAKNGKR